MQSRGAVKGRFRLRGDNCAGPSKAINNPGAVSIQILFGPGS